MMCHLHSPDKITAGFDWIQTTLKRIARHLSVQGSIIDARFGNWSTV